MLFNLKLMLCRSYAGEREKKAILAELKLDWIWLSLANDIAFLT